MWVHLHNCAFVYNPISYHGIHFLLYQGTVLWNVETRIVFGVLFSSPSVKFWHHQHHNGQVKSSLLTQVYVIPSLPYFAA
jgi:hypothetical protein